MTVGSGIFAKVLKNLTTHLVKAGGGLSGELFDLRRDVANVLAMLAAITRQEFTNPIAASGNAIKTAVATIAAITTYSYAAFTGALVASPSPYARNLSVTSAGSTPANVPATVTFTGLYRGRPQTETVAPNTSGGVVNTTKPFDVDTAGLKALVISMPAAGGTGATLAFGIGAGLGVGATPKLLAGGVVLVREVADGALVTTGALTATGLYTPATAPNGTHDYGILFEFDAAAELPESS